MPVIWIRKAMFNIALIEKRATNVINGFVSAKGINATDTLRVVAEKSSGSQS